MNKEGIQKLEAQANSLFYLLMRTVKKYIFLRPIMSDRSLRERMNEDEKSAGFEHLKYVLYHDFIQDLVKLYADNDERAPTIIVDKIQKPSVAEIFKEKYSRRRSSETEELDDESRRLLEEKDEEELRNRFKTIYDRLLRNTDELLGSELADKYKTIRDRLIAHNELRKTEGGYDFFDISELGLKYGDESLILEKVKVIVDDINSVIRQAGFTWNDFYDQEKRKACAFWKVEDIKGLTWLYPG